MSRIISTRRQVVTEQDRYGGYRSREFSTDSAQDRAFGETTYYTDRTERPQHTARTFEYDDYEFAPAPPVTHYDNEPVQYSGHDYSTEIGLIPAAKFAKTRRTPEEMMPRIENPEEKRVFFKEKEKSARPAQMQEIERRPAVREKAAMSAKVALFLYITAVLMLAAIVIGTGVAINGATDRINALESERTAAMQALNHQANELDKLSDPVYIAGLALGQDMEKIDSYTEIELIELSEPTTYSTPSNWFDRFCDWVSGFFG